jgi:hypothetical protein
MILGLHPNSDEKNSDQLVMSAVIEGGMWYIDHAHWIVCAKLMMAI